MTFRYLEPHKEMAVLISDSNLLHPHNDPLRKQCFLLLLLLDHSKLNNLCSGLIQKVFLPTFIETSLSNFLFSKMSCTPWFRVKKTLWLNSILFFPIFCFPFRRKDQFSSLSLEQPPKAFFLVNIDSLL